MKWVILAGVVIAAGLLARAIHRRQLADRVSADWLYQQERRDEQNTFEGVAWSWPVKKLSNDAAHFNRARLRKSA